MSTNFFDLYVVIVEHGHSRISTQGSVVKVEWFRVGNGHLDSCGAYSGYIFEPIHVNEDCLYFIDGAST